VAVIYGKIGVRNRATAAKVGPGPGTTQQIGVDNSNIPNMRAAVGSMKQAGSAVLPN
jgi:hypothetical protein